MSIADEAICIHHAAQWHASQLEEIDLLPVLQSNPVIGVRQADKRDALIAPVLLKGGRGIGSHSQDRHTAADEFLVLIPQARQLRAAVRSLKAAQECQQDRPATELRQANAFAVHILQLKVWCKIPWCDQLAHVSLTLVEIFYRLTTRNLPAQRFQKTGSGIHGLGLLLLPGDGGGTIARLQTVIPKLRMVAPLDHHKLRTGGQKRDR